MDLLACELFTRYLHIDHRTTGKSPLVSETSKPQIFSISFDKEKYLYKELGKDCDSVVDAQTPLQQTNLKLPKGYLILKNVIV